MKRILLYEHGGSGNHGCEALVRSTMKVLGADNQYIVSSMRPEEDEKFGVGKLCKVLNQHASSRPSISLRFLRAYWQLKIHHNNKPMDELATVTAFGVQKNDIALSIGGDTYCYGGCQGLIDDHRMWKENGMKTVLWGCSMEPELTTDAAISADLKNFDLITARETISYEALKKVNPNTVLVCDSAFHLELKELPLPDGFEAGKYICINTSPLIEKNESKTGIARQNYIRLIERILDTTDLNVMLLPHVTWEHDDDRIVLQKLKQSFADNNRVFVLEEYGCEELKGYIARARFFVGARTHASIAAYSTGVPTLVVGYSVKARGIARDLFGSEEHYVLPVQKLKEESDLADAFAWIQEHESEIRNCLLSEMESYKARISNAVKAINQL